MKKTLLAICLLVATTQNASANSRNLPAHVSVRNLFGGVTKALVYNHSGDLLAYLSQTGEKEFSDRDGNYTLTNIGKGFFETMRVRAPTGDMKEEFYCRKFSGAVPTQPDGTRDSLECLPEKMK